MMTIFNTVKKYVVWSVVLAFCWIGNMQTSRAQFTDYQRLAFIQDRPNLYVDVFPLPGDDGNSIKLTTIFKISYNSLPFKKLNSQSRNEEFFSTAEVSLELFQSPEKNLRPFEEVDVEDLASVNRATWRDTAYAADYEQTKSSDKGLSGSMQITVSPGNYTYLMQVNNDGENPVQRQQFDNDRRRRRPGNFNGARTRNIHVLPYERPGNGDVILVDKVDDLDNPSKLSLINMGDNVTYGKDFYAFVYLPNYESGKSYTLQINQVEMRDRDTTTVNSIDEQKIADNQIIENIKPRLVSQSNNISLAIDQQNNGFAYALVPIPNSKFPNAVYRLTVTSDQSQPPVAQGIFRSYWSDIPTSLLSLDVATDMLKFIADKETIDRLNKGNAQEREQKFREFWKKKDPTPDTEFNELQAEYYRRIDYAYENFGSENNPGYNSDRGRIYINYGPPQDIKRTFPANDATTEVWTYKNRKFVFKATSGFGDFKLVSE